MVFKRQLPAKEASRDPFEILVSELISIGRQTRNNDTFFYRPKGEGIGPFGNWDPRTREIGQELYRMGGNKIQLMLNAHRRVVEVLGYASGSCLESHWHEIGVDEWKQRKGEAWLR